MTKLPDFEPVGVETIQSPAWYRPMPMGYGKAFPDITKAPDGRIVVDWCGYPAMTDDALKHVDAWGEGNAAYPMPFKVVVWRHSDHPNLALLPQHTPRKVKALYRAEHQLKMLRFREDALAIYLDAVAAWEKFLIGMARRDLPPPS